MENTKLNNLLKQKNPNLEEVLMCDEILTLYRMSVRNVVNFFTQKSVIKQMFNLMRTSNKFQIIRKIVCLHISPNTSILHELIEYPDLVNSLLLILDRPSDVNRYVIGSIASIFQKMIENWPHDTFSIFNNTVNNYIRLFKTIHIPSIYHLLTRFVTDADIQTVNGQPFVWMLYLALMDEHGPGCRVPQFITQLACYNSTVTKLDSLQREKIISLLTSYFNDNIDDQSELFRAVTLAIPLILQDAVSDHERALVFKLGLTLNPNEAMGLSALSIINCFKSEDILLQFALMYIAAFEVNIGYRSLELFLYRLLSKEKQNNFVIIATAKLILSLVNETKERSFISNIRQIVSFFCEKKETVSNRAYRSSLLMATNGVDFDVESEYSDDIIYDADDMFMHIVVDQKLISQLKQKMQSIESNKIFVPLFAVKDLVKKDEKARMEKLFKNIDKLDIKMFKSNSKPKIVYQNPDVELEDIYGTQTVQQTKPPKPQKPVLVPIDSDSDDDIIQLEEIEVTDTFPGYAEKPAFKGSGPLTVQESVKEPIPLVELSRANKPVPKNFMLSPISPRSQLRRSSQSSYDSSDSWSSKTPKLKQKVRATNIDKQMILDEHLAVLPEDEKQDTVTVQPAKQIQSSFRTETKTETKTERKHEFRIEKVVEDLFIDRMKEKKRPTLNRKVLIVEIYEKPMKLKLCQLDYFEFYSAQKKEGEKQQKDPEVNNQQKKHKHRSRSAKQEPV